MNKRISKMSKWWDWQCKRCVIFEIDNFLRMCVFVCVFMYKSYSTYESGRSTRCEFFINHLYYQSYLLLSFGKKKLLKFIYLIIYFYYDWFIFLYFCLSFVKHKTFDGQKDIIFLCSYKKCGNLMFFYVVL